MIKVENTVLVNGDDPADIAYAKESSCVVITCGLSLKSTVTASSIGDDGFTYCLQRSIIAHDRQKIEPQEFNVRWFEKPSDIFPYLAFVTTLLLCGVSTDIFAESRF